MGATTPAIPGGYYLTSRMISEDLEEKPAHYLKLWDWMLRRAFFKDGKDLKRGEFLTTIDEMRYVGGYNSGSARKPLTKDQVRSAYGHLTGAGRITTRKTTRGMVITVCNYDELQNPKSYEPHTAPLATDLTETSRTPHDREMNEETKNKEKNKPSTPPPPGEVKPVKPVEVVPFSETVMWISNDLARLVLANNPKNRELQEAKRESTVLRWAKDIDKMIRLDHREPREVAEVVRWCQKDSFWSQNILSGLKLREQYDKLILKMKGTVLAVVPQKPAKETRLDRNAQACIEAARMLGIVEDEEVQHEEAIELEGPWI